MISDINILKFFIQKLKEQSNVHTYTNKDENYNQHICIICYEEFNNNSIIYELVCKHIYHKKCILNWSRYNDICPICKKDL